MSSITTTGAWGCAWVCKGVRGYVQGCTVWAGVRKCALVCIEVRGCLRVCVWDEFSEYLLENRVTTSADFNTYPIRIFFANIEYIIRFQYVSCNFNISIFRGMFVFFSYKIIFLHTSVFNG